MPNASRSHYSYATPHGPVSILVSDRGVARISFGEDAMDHEPAPARRSPTELANRAATELLEYLAGKRRSFDVPLDLAGTDFQRAVWAAVARIPYGETTTSSALASALGEPKAFRTVGAAVRANPVPLLVPTHRVVGANGRPLANEAFPAVSAGARALEATACGTGKR